MSAFFKRLSIVVFLFCFIIFGQAENVSGFQTDKTDLENLRTLFTEAVGQDFEIVKDILNERPVARGGEIYWLVHVKPKKSGHYALKYTFKYTHKFTHPEEGENELFIRVGAENCNRYNVSNLGLGNVCLGDTVIVPIRLDKAAAHQFSLKSTYQDGENIGKKEQNALNSENLSNIEKVKNPLETHLKYLGTRRIVMPHRNAGETVTYSAIFEAKSVGRFNLGLSTSSGDEKVDKTIKMDALNAFPIIVVNPGTPVTALVYHQNTINYSDNKKFSGRSGQNFLTKLLILQPGDIFEIQYSSFTNRWETGKKSSLEGIKDETHENPKLLIQKLPFTVNKDWSYNEWLIDYLPPEN